MKNIAPFFEYKSILSGVDPLREQLVLQTPEFGFSVVSRLDLNSALARELGRARELTFASTGKGSGNEVDLDAFDAIYSHIIARSNHDNAILGACRFVRGDQILESLGLQGFYRSKIFDLSQRSARLASALEVGRIFVSGKEQKDGYYKGTRGVYRGIWQALKLSQQGLPPLEFLVGALSISNKYSDVEKEKIVNFYLNAYPAKNKSAVAVSLNRPILQAYEVPVLDKSILRPELFRISQIHYPKQDLAYEDVAINPDLGSCWEVYFECALTNPDNYWGRL